MIKKILLIPSSPQLYHPKRLKEIGKFLSKRHDTFMLYWNDFENCGFVSKFFACLSDIFKKPQVYEQSGMLLAQYPFLRWPSPMIDSFNSGSLAKFITEFKIDTVVNQTCFLFPTPFLKKYHHILDLSDLDITRNLSLASPFFRFLTKEIQKADIIIVDRQFLIQYIKERFNRRAQFIPSGLHLDEFNRVDFEEVKRIRQSHNLFNKFVLGYIGEVDSSIDIDFLMDLFLDLKKKGENTAFMVVSNSPSMNYLKSQIKDSNFIFVNNVAANRLNHYFFSLNAGVIPAKKGVFGKALYGPLLGYSAAKKIVISSPVDEVKNMNFLNVVTAELNVNEWAKALEAARAMRWDLSWDSFTAEYDWQKIAERFSALIENK